MSVPLYRALFALAASVCLLTAGCGSDKVVDAPPAPAAPEQQAEAAAPDSGMDTESTIWTIMGLAKKPSELRKGPKLGPQVSPSLWQAAHDALSFVKLDSEDPMSGMVQTAWYSPPGKPDERLRVSVFVLSIALRTDSLAVTVDREVRSPTGQWQKSTVDREVVDNLENTILLRARHLHAEEYRSMM
ncbi:MAG TPA: DUF3576 domain-containing protein [Stellaceae bacterium]|jgi:hypothetical protein